jgi:hypothetical protein
MVQASNKKPGRVERRTELETLYRPFVPGFTRNQKNPEMTDCFKRSLEAFLGLKLKRPKETTQTGEEGEEERLEFDASSEKLVSSPRANVCRTGDEDNSIQRTRYKLEYELKGRHSSQSLSIRNTSPKIAALGACLHSQFIQPHLEYMQKLLNVSSTDFR